MSNSKRVFNNTIILYIQLVIGVSIGLFTTRILLNALGETDYGIYILVAGVIGMLNILNSNMSNTAMRFMSHSLGTSDELLIKKTFNTTIFLHIIVGICVVIIMQLGGWVMFEFFLNIPEEKLTDARYLYQFMIATTFITVVSVPYDAVMNAHENLVALSVTDILGYVFKLITALVVLEVTTNKLIIYGLLLLFIELTLRLIKQAYSRKKYMECKISFAEFIDIKLIKQILSFTSWNLFGSIGYVAVNQIRSLILNSFFGVKINAADGISNNASSQVNMFSVNLTRAINPQLIKSESSGDRQKMLFYTKISTKYSTFLFSFFAIPIIIKMPYLLELWLKDVPEYTFLFAQIILIGMLIEKFTFQITDAIRAVGVIKRFQITETFFRILNIPAAYIVFKFGAMPYSIYIVSVFVSIIIFFNRLYFGKKIAGIIPKDFLNKALLPVTIPIIITFFLTYILSAFTNENILNLIFVFAISFLTMFITFWFIGVDINERIQIRKLFDLLIIKLKLK